jgi:toxin secretion/phage lysis holin
MRFLSHHNEYYKFFGYFLGFIACLYSPNNTLIPYLCVVIFFDYVLGVLRAWIQGKYSRDEAIKGVIKKVGYFILIALAHILDVLMGLDWVVERLMMYVLITNDIISVLEHCKWFGIDINIFIQLVYRFRRKVKKDVEDVIKDEGGDDWEDYHSDD